MSGEKTTLEMIAPSVEEAVQKGLEQLGLSAAEVEVDVLDMGSKGLFGLGSRQARVRLTVKSSETLVTAPMIPQPVVPEVGKPRPAVNRSEKPSPPVQMADTSVTREEANPDLTPEEQESLRVSLQVVKDLLDKMKIDAQVHARIRRAEDAEDEDTVQVNIEGDDLSILIGRRTETLNALQYIASLIVGKQLDRWTPLTIDVQGYRARRERQLRTLARRMADQAIHTGRKQVLEPMPANERRVIHLELRDHPRVETESIGEEPNRKITILLKK